MTTYADGQSHCDYCGVSVTGSVQDCVIVVWYNADINATEHLHYCLDRQVVEVTEDENGEESRRGKDVKGCSRKVLTPAVKAQRTKLRQAEQG